VTDSPRRARLCGCGLGGCGLCPRLHDEVARADEREPERRADQGNDRPDDQDLIERAGEGDGRSIGDLGPAPGGTTRTAASVPPEETSSASPGFAFGITSLAPGRS
jgi:hypothetical protein